MVLLVWLLAFCACAAASAQDGSVQPIPDLLEPVYIHGRVVDEAGERVSGVKVVANHNGFGDTIRNAWTNANHAGVNGVTAVSGDDGVFSIRVPYAGISYHIGFAPGGCFHTESVSVIPPVEDEGADRAQPVVLVAVPYGRPKTREVEVSLPDGSPAADVPVTLVSEYGVRWTSQTDERGRAVFEGLDVAHGLRQACVEIATDDGLVAPITIVGWRRPPDEPTPVRLTQPATLVGTVRATDTGEPVADATVIVKPSFMSGLEWRTTTEDDGWFQLVDLPPGQYWYRVVSTTHTEWLRRGWNWKSRSIELRPGEVTEADRIDMQQRAVLRGRVIGPDGQPVPGAMVACTTHADPDYRLGNDLVFTDAAGRFEFRVGQFARAQSPIQVYHSVAGVAWLKLDPIQPGEVRDDVELVTAGSIRISGTVTGEDGQPLAGIGCRYTGNRSPVVYTDDTGRYDLGRVLLRPTGDDRLAVPVAVAFFYDRPEVGLQALVEHQDPPAEAPYYTPTARETQPGPDGHAVVDAVMQQTDLLTFAGTLVGPDGKPYEGAIVYLLAGRVTDDDAESRKSIQLFLNGRDRNLRAFRTGAVSGRPGQDTGGLEELVVVPTNEDGAWAMRCLRSDADRRRAYAGRRGDGSLLPEFSEEGELLSAPKLEWVTLLVTWEDGRYQLETPIRVLEDKTDYDAQIAAQPQHVRFELPDESWEEAIAAAMVIQAREGTLQARRPQLLLGVDDPQARQELYARWNEERFEAEREDGLAMGMAMSYGGPELLEVLTASLEHESESVRHAAGMRISHCGPPAMEPMMKALLENEDPGVRIRMAGCLSRFRDPAVIPFLVKALEDEDDETRRTAVVSLAGLHAEEAFDVIAGVFEQDIHDERSRTRMAYAMIGLDAERSRAWFLEVATRLDTSHPDYKDIKPDLLRRFQRDPPISRTPAPSITVPQRNVYWLARHAVTIAGESYGDAEIQGLIKHMADPIIGRDCLAAIRHLRAPEAAPELMRLIQEAEEPWHYYSTLLAVGGEPAWRYVVDVYQNAEPPAKEGDVHLKSWALAAFGSVGDAGLPMLMLLLDDYLWYNPGRVGLGRRQSGYWDHGTPPSHSVLGSIGSVLGTLQTVERIPPNRDTFLWDESEAMKQWWSNNAEAFIAGEPTPDPPPVTRYFPPFDP